MIPCIGNIAYKIPFVLSHAKNQQVDQMFSENPKLQGIVVVNNNFPIALVTRTHFYQKLGTLYGYNLYMGREIDLLMNVEPLIVDYYQTIIQVSQLAMNRKEEEMYDYVIVTKNEEYYGVVSIRKLLIEFAEAQSEMASFMNPLTGLPGNHVIEEKLNEALKKENFTMLYIDLDQFKAYNDTYGFKKGDEVIQSTAEILKQSVVQQGFFVGHIGGDDFIAILDDCDYEETVSCIIKNFDQSITRFYKKEHLEKQYIIAENRSGQIEKIPLLSISIAVVNNQNCSFNSIEEIINEATRIKKICKTRKQSCYEVNTPCCTS